MQPNKKQLETIATHLENASILLTHYPTSQSELREFKKKLSSMKDVKQACEQAIVFFTSMHKDIKETLASMEQSNEAPE